MKKITLTLSAFVLMVPILSASTWNTTNDRFFSMRNSAPAQLEDEYHQQIQKESKIQQEFPLECHRVATSHSACSGESWPLTWSDQKDSAGFKFLTGVEWRSLQEVDARVWDLGLISRGVSGSFSWFLDARVHTEIQDTIMPSHDREYVEREEKGDNSAIDYTSYGRYRTNFNLDTDFGRFTFARDALHWGPSVFHPLMFSQEAVPYNHLIWQSHFGPFSLYSVYAELSIDGGGRFRGNDSTRTLYAHRYVWDISKQVTLGVSENLIVFNDQVNMAVIPVVPLFMAKGSAIERNNNGNIAGDLTIKIPNRARLYGEFLIDDVTEPTKLFNDHWDNKWAVTLGFHVIQDFKTAKAGFVSEWNRTEPWVYTHDRPNTGQMAHNEYAIAAPMGPNSMSISQKLYWRTSSFYAGLRSDLVWKGEDAGSALNDPRPASPADPKQFLADEKYAQWNLQPHLSWSNGLLSLEAWANLNNLAATSEIDLFSRIVLMY
jgi:hypothetical protein